MNRDWLLSVDPGLRVCGCALWREYGDLAAAALVHGSKVPIRSAAVSAMIDAVFTWADQHTPARVHVNVICEYPQTYGGMSVRGDTNDLIRIALVAGGIARHTLSCPRDWEGLVLPHEWKGTIPKKTCEGVNLVEERSRAQLSRSELGAVVLPAKSLQHNVWDAVGIGLWSLKRRGIRG